MSSEYFEKIVGDMEHQRNSDQNEIALLKEKIKHLQSQLDRIIEERDALLNKMNIFIGRVGTH